MVFIESAYLGDEQGMKNVTKVLMDKIMGSSIKVPVDDKLIPPFEVVEKTELTKGDEKKIREAAEKACGGPDQACMEVQMGKMRQQALVAKSTLANSSANVVKGRRLTVNVLDDEGNRRRMVIPDGHNFELDGLSPTDPRKPDQAIPSLDYFKGQFLEFSGIAIVTFVWVFGIVATYALFARAGFGYIAGVLAFIAFILPGSGYVMIFLYFILNSFVNNYTTMV
jgi:hypothetical protein